MIGKILCITSVFYNLLRLVSQTNIWSILGNIICAFEKSVYPAVVGQSVLYVSQVQLVCSVFLSPVFPYCFYVWLFCLLLEGGYWSLYSYCRAVSFSLKFCQCLLHIFRSSNVWYMYVYSCYMFLMNWHIYHYIMSFDSCISF